MADWRYQRLPVPPELFAETTAALGVAGFLGANVTIPHKERALQLADEASAAARAIGAANTLTFHAEGSISAENTDAPGLIATLPRSAKGLRATVLGAGGSARAAVWALSMPVPARSRSGIATVTEPMPSLVSWVSWRFQANAR